MHRDAFTVVELLIVITIISILAGLLFPVLAKARDRAKQASCFSNERQLGMALMLYAGDKDDRLPSGTIGSEGMGWAGQIYPYVKSVGVYRCPSDNGKEENISAGLWALSYSLNTNAVKATFSDFFRPSATVLLFEVNAAAANFGAPETTSPTGRGVPTDNCPSCGKPFGADYYSTGDLGLVKPALSTTIRPVHDPTSNFLAADGHVKALIPDRVSPGYEAPTSSSPQANYTAAGTDTLLDGWQVFTFSLR